MDGSIHHSEKEQNTEADCQAPDRASAKKIRLLWKGRILRKVWRIIYTKLLAVLFIRQIARLHCALALFEQVIINVGSGLMVAGDFLVLLLDHGCRLHASLKLGRL